MRKASFFLVAFVLVGFCGCRPVPKWQLVSFETGLIVRMDNSTGEVQVLTHRGTWISYAETMKNPALIRYIPRDGAE
jgi:hypothetical protein